MGIGSVRQNTRQPRKGWTNKDWLEHAHIMVHSPWIDEEEREYWRDKIKNLTQSR